MPTKWIDVELKLEYDELERWEPEPLPKSLTDYVRRTGKPLYLDGPGFQDLAQTGEVGLVGTDSAQWLGVPLTTDAGVIGVIAVQSYHDPELYSFKDLELLEIISTSGPRVREVTNGARYVTPEQFKAIEKAGRAMGFLGVYAGPFVRSSYRAEEAYLRARA